MKLKVNTFTKDQLKEFEEVNGYPMGTDFIFAVGMFADEVAFAIQPKSYWDNEKCQYDEHVDYLFAFELPGFDETCEATFEYNGTTADGIKILLDLGFEFDADFQNFLLDHDEDDERNFKVNNMSVPEYVNCLSKREKTNNEFENLDFLNDLGIDLSE